MLIGKIHELLNLVEKKNILEKQLLETKTNIIDLKKDMEDFFSAFRAKESQLKDLKKNVKLLELEITAMVDLGRSLKGRIGSLFKLREIESAKHELLVAQSKQENAEENLLINLEKIDKLESSLKFDAEKLKSDHEVFLEKERLLNEFEKNLSNELMPIEEGLRSLSESLPEEFINKYRRVLSKLPNPVVAVHGSDCSACYTTLTQEAIGFLKQKKIGDCAACGRILFYLN